MSDLRQFSYILVGEQTDWATQITDPLDMVPRLYEFTNSTLRRRKTTIENTRLRGSINAPKNIDSLINAAGNITFHIHESDMLLWFKHWLMVDTIDTDPNAAVSVKADGAWVNNVAFTLTSQPNAVLVDAIARPIPCGKLVFTFTTTTGTGTITIVGRDQNGLRISEVKATGTDPTVVTSTLYYATVESVTISGLTPGTVQINANPDSYTHQLAVGNAVLDGLTIEELKGQVPNTYHGGIIQSGVLTLANLVTLAFTLICRDGDLRRGLEGDPTATDLTGFTRVSQEVAQDWGMALSINSVVYPISAASLTYGNNIDYPNARFLSDFYLRKPIRKGFTALTLSGTVEYDASNNFDTLAYDTEIVAALHARNKPYAGRYSSTTFNLPQAELTEFPDPELANLGEIPQTLSVRGYGSDDLAVRDELNVVLVNGDAGIP